MTPVMVMVIVEEGEFGCVGGVLLERYALENSGALLPPDDENNG